MHSCYEAGRDGWWLHRWLSELGVDNIVVDAASIEVNRRARRAKTDRFDADKLLAMLVRHHGGEHVWSVLREPSREDEDARRVHRELQRLAQERIAHTNRIGSLLVLHNLRPRGVIGGRDWAVWWDRHRDQVPSLLRAEIEREGVRLKLVREQVRAVEAARCKELAEGKQPLVAHLTRLRAIGPKGAWVLVKEVFGWRHFANRRELAGSLGLVPTPYASGSSVIEQGISKAGKPCARQRRVQLHASGAVELPAQRGLDAAARARAAGFRGTRVADVEEFRVELQLPERHRRAQVLIRLPVQSRIMTKENHPSADTNLDPLTGEPDAHRVCTGLGAAVGAVVGAAAGAMAGPSSID